MRTPAWCTARSSGIPGSPLTRGTGKRPCSIAPTPSAGSCPNRQSGSGTTGCGRPRGLRGGPVGLRNDPGRGRLRTRNTVLVGVVGVLGLLVACAGDPPTAPTAPTRSTPAATGEELSVHAPPWFAERRELDEGQEVQLSANIRISDGTTREGVDADWTSSNTVVATITSSGALTGRQPGGFEVLAEAEGLSARLSGLRVVPPGEPDFTIRNVHRYPVRDRAAHWIEFDVQARVAIGRLELGIRIYANDLFVDCDQRLYGFGPGELQEETVIPNVCGLDVQWTHFTITPRDGLGCEGCGRYSLEDVPVMEGGIDP